MGHFGVLRWVVMISYTGFEMMTLLTGEQRAGSEEITNMVQKMTMAQTRFWGGLRIYITGSTDKI